MRLLFDTNALLRATGLSRPLGRRSEAAAERARGTGELYFSAVSAIEIEVLIRKKRLDTRLTLDAVIADFERAEMREVAIESLDVVGAHHLGELHQDPNDRLLVAQARRRDLTLLTSDEVILRWPGDLSRLDADQ
jgi:PIN domain nuclease of toxin-antitoxin system